MYLSNDHFYYQTEIMILIQLLIYPFNAFFCLLLETMQDMLGT